VPWFISIDLIDSLTCSFPSQLNWLFHVSLMLIPWHLYLCLIFHECAINCLSCINLISLILHFRLNKDIKLKKYHEFGNQFDYPSLCQILANLIRNFREFWEFSRVRGIDFERKRDRERIEKEFRMSLIQNSTWLHTIERSFI